MTARLVVADDSTLLREGLVGLLERQGFTVVAQETHADGLLDRIRVLKEAGAKEVLCLTLAAAERDK